MRRAEWAKMVRKRLIDKDWLMRDLANEIGHTRQNIHQTLVGSRKNPETIKSISAALGIEPYEDERG